jgi:uncharacterized Fe-S center protein
MTVIARAPDDTLIGNSGVMPGKDPVALDTACWIRFKKCSGKRLSKRGGQTLRHAEKTDWNDGLRVERTGLTDH